MSEQVKILKCGDLLQNKASGLRRRVVKVSEESFFVDIEGRAVEYDNWMFDLWTLLK